jgi:hypothetical protein
MLEVADQALEFAASLSKVEKDVFLVHLLFAA